MIYLQPKSLLRYDEKLLGFDVIDNQDTDLNELNKDKSGEQAFHHTNISLLLLDYVKVYINLQ